MIRNLIVLFVVVVLVVLGMAAYHLRSVRAIGEQPVHLFHWEDTGGRATVQQVMQTSGFRPVRQRRVNVGYTESVHWFRFRLVANRFPQELTFEIRNHTIDRLELFAVKNGRTYSLGQTGSRLPFVQRPSPTKTFAYLLTVEPGQPTDYYLRLDKRYENLATELTLWRTDDFEDKEQREYFLWGIFSGVVGLMVLLAFLFFVATRDPIYGGYGLYILGLALRQFADTGLGFQFLWPATPAINQPDPVIQSLWLYLPAMLLFQQLFLELRTESKRAFWLTEGLKYTMIGLFIGLVVCQLTGLTESFVGADRLIRQIHTVVANMVLLAFAVNIIVGLRASDTAKRLYALGCAIQTIGQLLVTAQSILGYQRDGFFFVDTYLILMVNFFIDLVIFAYLLAYRYRKSIDDQRQLQLGLAQMQQHTNEAIIDVLESERQQVGTLILADVGGRLTNTRTLLSGLSPNPLLTEALGLIDKTDDCLDQILRDSLPPDLLEKGLPAALAELVQQRTQTALVRLSFTHETSIEKETAHFSVMQTRQLYRIANELVNNLIKHAQATEGQVRLVQMPAGWQLIVADNGRGFSASNSQKEGGIGLKNIYARAQTLGASVQITSGETGTTVVVDEQNTNKFV
jgi:two-component system, sensor histidine kinase LadS